MTRWVIAGLSAVALLACGPSRGNGFADGGNPPVDTGLEAGVDAAHPGDAAMSCAQQSDCDDGLACTTDLCVIGGVCQHTSTCASGQFCGPSGCATTRSCTANADCDDGVACTRDVCAAGGTCENLRDDSQCNAGQTCSTTLGCVAQGRCAADVDCDDTLYCDGQEHCVVSGGSGTCAAGTPPDCSTGMTCVVGSCSEAMRQCVQMTLNPCGGSVTPGTYSLSPTPAYSCVAGTLSVGSTISLAVGGSGGSAVTVMGFLLGGAPITLSGTAPTGGMFAVSDTTSAGGCTWTITLSGSFTTAGHFTGSWSASQSDCLAGSGDCTGGSGLVDGTMH